MRRDLESSNRAFSLLEVIVALAIISLLVTIFAVKFSEADDGQAVLKPSNQLRKLARRANRLSANYRQEYRITFFEDAFFLSRPSLLDRQTAEESSIESVIISPETPLNLKIRRFGSSKWLTPDGAEWVFQPAGLCEPLEVRFANEQDFVELLFNPMTAEVDHQRFVFE